MFELNPHNLPDAQWQLGVMLVVAAILGFIIGYISRKRVVALLETELNATERALDDCLRQKVQPKPAKDEESMMLDRIRARANELDFSRIGTATLQQADDLKVIVGVGPFLEKKLHAIGIYTFRQIASFTKEDVDKVNDIIEFFPGRIERDNWVGQAAELAKNK